MERIYLQTLNISSSLPFIAFSKKLSSKKSLLGLIACFSLLLTIPAFGQNVLVNPGAGSYPTLKDAFDAINVGTHTGVVTVEIVLSTTETASAVLNASGTGGASYTSILIRPAAAASNTVTGSIAGPLIDLNGADNVTIEGSNLGSSLILANTATGAVSTIRFINDASNNIIQNSQIQGSSSVAANGTVFFSTGTTTGNDGNNINNCFIRAAGANNPINGIFSAGTSAVVDNSGNTINQNNIADYFNATLGTAGINLASLGNSAWTITGNKLFQTATRIYTASQTHLGIFIGVGSGYTVNNNIIGFNNPGSTGTTNLAGVTTGTITGSFPSAYTLAGVTLNATRYIALSCAFTIGGTVSDIQNNTIGGFALLTSSGAATTNGVLCGINVTSGNANIGTTTGNTIGATSGLGSMYAAVSTTGGQLVGIYASSTNTVSINNNTFGALEAVGTTATITGGVTAIDATGTAGTFTINSNTIGNTTPDNIRAGYTLSGANLSNAGVLTSSTGGSSFLLGIRNTSSGSTFSAVGNTIRGFATSGTVTAVTGITTSGSVQGAVNINSNAIGISGLDFIRYAFANSGSLVGINASGLLPAAPLTMNLNDIRGITYSVAGTGSNTYLTWSHATAVTDNITNNTFTNLNVNTSGSVTFMTRTSTMTAPGAENVNDNSIVTAFNKGGSGGTVTFFSAVSTSTNGTTMVNNLNNFSNVTVIGSTSITGWVNTEGASASSSPTKTITNNTFNNITASTTPTGAITMMNINSSGPGSLVSDNKVTTITGGSAIIGILLNTTNQSLTVTKNLISNLASSGGGAVTGISTAAPFVTISKNKIHDIGGTNVATSVNGILVTAGTTTNIAHNLIGNLTASAANTADAIRGISSTSTSLLSAINIYFNTIYMNATSSGTPFGTSGIYHTISTTASTATLNLRNNIIINTSTPAGAGLTVAYRRSLGTANALANYASTSNNNLFYAGTPSATNLIYSDGTTAAQTLAAYKAGTFTAGNIAPRDNSSVTEDLTGTFLSTTGSSPDFLHINTAILTQVENGGVAISGYSDDYDNISRNASTPDMGADEGTFMLSDITGPSISYTTLTTTACTTDKTISVGGVDASGVDVNVGTKPRLYFRKTTNANTFNDNTSATDGWKYVEASNASSPFSFTTNYSLLSGGGGVVGGDVIEYFVVSQDNAVTPNFSINTGTLTLAATSVALTAANFPVTLANSFTVQAAPALSGTVTLGAVESYTSLTGATGLFNAINTNGLASNLVVNIMDATITEAGTTALNAINYIGCADGPYTVTIKPNTTTTITGSVASGAILKLNGADYVTIDGSNNGSSSRNLTITNTSVTSPAAIWLSSAGTGAGADHNTIKNTIISTGANTATSYGIALAGSALGSAGADNDFVLIQNNTINKVYHAIWANGSAAFSVGGLDNLSVTENIIGPTTSGADNIGFSGVNIANAVNPSVSLNTVQNISSTATGPGGILIAASVLGAVVSQNTIQNLTGTGARIYGILLNGTPNAAYTVNRNIINNISSGGADYAVGIETVVTGVLIDRNNVQNIVNSNTSTYGAFGISVISGNNATVQNNFVGSVLNNQVTGSGGFSTTFGAMGIRITVGTGHKVYHNSIHLTGVIPGATSTNLVACLGIAATSLAGIDVRNNIFSNQATGGNPTPYQTVLASVFVPSGGINGMNLNLNNNAYFQGGAANSAMAQVGTTGSAINTYLAANFNPASTSPSTNFRSYSSTLSVSGSNDNASFASSLAPPFTSVTDLHIPAATNSQLESGGATVAVSYDYDNDLRPGPAGSVNGGATARDMGADEFDGIPASPMVYVSSTTTQNNTTNVGTNASNAEIIGVQIVTTGSLSPVNATSFSFNTTGTTSLSDISNARLWYTGTSAVFAATNQVGTTVAMPAGPFNITGTQALSQGTNYFWLTYDVACTATVANVVDAECNSLTVGAAQVPTVQAPAGSRTIEVGPISGTKTVGSGGDFATLTAAITKLNSVGMNGNLILDITGNLAEPGAVVINQWLECGGSNFSLTIKPATGVNATISGSVASGALIKFNGADRVIIDGSNNGSTSRNLTITNTNTTSPTAVSIVSLGTALGAQNDKVKNCNISTAFTATTSYGISIGGNTPGTSGADNDNVQIQNNIITVATTGIYAAGTASVSAGGLDNLLITENNTNTVNSVVNFGIRVGNALNSTVSKNTVSVETSAADQPVGISLETGFVSSSVSKNTITKVISTNTGGYAGRGITIGTGTASSALTIDNNMISGVNGTNWSSFGNSSAIGIGIGIIGNSTSLATIAGGINLYNNTINMYGNYSISSNCVTAALYVGSAASALDIRDNIFVNSLTNTGTGSASKSYAVYSAVANTAFANMNYNDYYVSGSQGVLGFLTADQATLAAFQTAFGQNANSVVIAPVFTSSSDLHLPSSSNVALNNLGVSIAGITTDIDEEMRDGTSPDMGIDEFTPVTGLDVGVSALVSPGVNGCKTAAETVTVTLKNYSINPIDFSVNNVTVTTTETGGYNSNFVLTSGVLAGGATQNVTMSGTINMSATGNYTFNSVSSLAGDVTPANDAMAPVIRTNSTMGGTYPVGAGQSGSGGYETLTAAVTAFNATNCLTAPIVFSLMDPTFSASETFPLTIQNVNTDAVNTLTIRPASGVNATISGTAPSAALIKVLSSNVIIDGSNNGTSTKNLTITNISTTAPSVLLFGSTGVVPITNSTVKNSVIVNGANVATAIVVSDATLGTAGYFNNITIQNNSIQRAFIGIYAIAVPAAGNGSGLNINTNDLNSTGANAIRLVGVYVQGVDGASVSGNNIANIEAATGESDRGIWFATSTVNSTISGNTISALGYTGTGAFAPTAINISPNVASANINVTGNTITNITGSGTVISTGITLGFASTNVTIQKNIISNIKNTNATTSIAAGIVLGSTSTTASVLTADNFIFDVAANGALSATNNGYGILVNAGAGYNIYHNTVHMNTNQAVDGNPAAINITSGVTAAGAIDLRNNIFSNSQSTGTNRYSIYSGAANTVFSAIDYNDYHTTGPNLGFIVSNRATLLDIQTGFGGNVSSQNILPYFVSATDLHINTSLGSALDNLGTPSAIAGVPTDIDGTTWNSPTDIGADEFTACNLVVTNTNDSGAGSLRDAINCAAAGSTVTISLPAMSVINLTSGQIPIGKNLIIAATGPLASDLILAGNSASRIFHVLPSFNLELRHLTMENATAPADGGAILVEGYLKLNNVVFQNNLELGVPKPLTLKPGATLEIITPSTVQLKN